MSIKVSNVSFTYLPKTPNAYKALNDVSFEIKDNSFTAIIGHTGSGKSTMVQMLNALLLPENGTIEVDGFIIDSKKKKFKNVKELRKHVGLVFQFPEYQLFEETIEKDVAFGLINFGYKKAEAIEKARKTLMDLGFDESYFTRSPFDLSGGERRKVALAGILSTDPQVIILDEPTAGLDPKSARDVMNMISDLHKQGRTIIVITHDMDIVFRYADHAIVLKNGEVAFDGNPDNLFENNREDLDIEIPKMVELINYLKEKGFNIPKDKTKTTSDIIEYIASVRGKKHE